MSTLPPAPPPRFDRSCVDCGRTIAAGQTVDPAQHGDIVYDATAWRCGSCARAVEAMLNFIAHDLVAHHDRRVWLLIRPHKRHSCLFCDIFHHARELALTKSDHALARAQRRNRDRFRRALIEVAALERSPSAEPPSGTS